MNFYIGPPTAPNPKRIGPGLVKIAEVLGTKIYKIPSSGETVSSVLPNETYRVFAIVRNSLSRPLGVRLETEVTNTDNKVNRGTVRGSIKPLSVIEIPVITVRAGSKPGSDTIKMFLMSGRDLIDTHEASFPISTSFKSVFPSQQIGKSGFVFQR